MFAIGTTSRVYFMYPDTESERNEWINTLQKIIDKLKDADKQKLQLSARAMTVPAKKAVEETKDVRFTLSSQR